jgi:hypothetical protein
MSLAFLDRHSVLTPILALIVWSLVVWVWMYATRLPAMTAAKIDPQSARFPGSLDSLPDAVRQVANNYNHLMEQPTIFYALAAYTYLAGHERPLTSVFAWSYVGLRVAHSLVQGTINIVPLRFLIFCLSTVVLMLWAGGEVYGLLAG